MLIVGTGNVEAPFADVVDGFVIHEERAIRVLNRAMRGEDGVVRLYNRGRDAWRRVHSKFQFALLAVVGGESLEKQRAETGSGSTTKRVEDEETLEGGAVV